MPKSKSSSKSKSESKSKPKPQARLKASAKPKPQAKLKTSAKAKAKTLLDQGREAFEAGNYNGAVRLLRSAEEKKYARATKAEIHYELGRALRGLKHYEESEKWLNEAAAFFAEGAPASDADLGAPASRRHSEMYIKTVTELAFVYDAQAAAFVQRGKLSEAANLLEQALVIRQKFAAAADPFFLANINRLAELYGKLDRKREALLLMKSAQVGAKTDSAKGPSRSLETAFLLADRLYADKKFAEADNLLAATLKTAEKEFGKEALQVARVLSFMAGKHVQGSPAIAQKYFRRALEIEKKQLGNEHISVAKTLRHLALCYPTGDKQRTALENEAKAIEFAAGVKGPDGSVRENLLAKLERVHTKSQEGEGALATNADARAKLARLIDDLKDKE